MIHLMKNAFYHEEKTKKLLCEFIMETDRLSIGPKCEQFEAGFSKYQKRKYAVLYNSGSSANLALIQALLNLGKLNKGDKVGVSALTWATSIMPLIELGLNPVPIDVSLKNLNVNSENLLKIKDDLKVLFITNLLGFCGDIDKIKKICKKKGIILLEDNCEALGSELNGIKLGNFGLASTFSFFVGHHLSTIEGGMVCTDDQELYEMLLMVRAYGWNKHLSEKKKSKMKEEHGIENNFYDSFTFYFLGYNLRPTEITGFIGVLQLKYIKEICKKRNDNFRYYEKIANENPDFQKLDFSHMNFISNFTYPLIFKDRETTRRYIDKFSEVEIRPIEANIIAQPFFKGQGYSCPNTKKIFDAGFFFPNNPDLTDAELKLIGGLLKKVFVT